MTAVTVSIARSTAAGGPDPLAFSGALTDAALLGIVSYQAPAHINLVGYAPPSGDVAGSEAVSRSLQQALLSFDWMCDTAQAESDMQAAYDAACAAVDQFSYSVTTAVGDAAAQVWSADSGSVTSPARTFVDLAHPNALVISVTIPVHPIPGSV
jgi:hypothetical protein